MVLWSGFAAESIGVRLRRENYVGFGFTDGFTVKIIGSCPRRVV